MLNWKSLSIGLILAVVLYFMFLSFDLGFLSILGFIVAPLIGGYIVGVDAKTGAINGAIIGLFGIIIVSLLLFVIYTYYLNPAVTLTFKGASTIIGLIIYAIIGAICGATGAIIKNRAINT